MTRFDLNKIDRDLINLGVSLGFTDAIEVACDLFNAGGDVSGVLEGMFEVVASYPHDTETAEARREWFSAYYARWVAIRAAS